ncbi:hypothetical protein ACTHO0_25465 [Cytobacillus praedii]|uniref:hypothetical protein n=1 Tax=Cytobacillus praedii TaxID=1742358 RepID=UPI003F7CFF80
MEQLLRAEAILELDLGQIELGKVYLSDSDLEEFELYEFELEKRRVKNLRENAAITMKLIDKETEIDYSHPPRPKFEFKAGFKIAKQRGVVFDKICIFNLYFRFKNKYLNGMSTAMMYREKPNNKEYILLLPDDTEKTYQKERRFYLDTARKLVFDFKMDSDEQDRLLENLNLLNRLERCAQSLQHEWGHILHYRCFDLLPKNNKAEQLKWFYEEGYVDLLDKRHPGLAFYEAKEFLYLVKEAFVEDIRISLNFKSDNGMFILPNAITYIRDFEHPELLIKGVRLVENMIEKLDYSKRGSSQQSSGEINRVEIGRNIAKRNLRYPEFSKTITPNLISNFIDELEEEEEEVCNKNHAFA